MTLVATQGIYMPSTFGLTIPAALTSSLLDASGEKFVWAGPVWNKDRATKSITKVGFLPGAITSAGGSEMRLSLQNIDIATATSVVRGDGTQDQTVDFLASAPTASTWYQTAALSASRSVAFGEMLAVVLEFNSFAGADAFNVQNVGNTTSHNGTSSCSLLTASYATVAVLPNIILEFDDGTFGTLMGGYPVSALTTISFNSATTPDEIALRFTVPFSCKIDGAWVPVHPGADNRHFDVILYEGTTALKTFSVDTGYLAANNAAKIDLAPFAEETLTPGTVYYLAVKPLTGGNANIYKRSVANANHLQALPGGTAWHYATRTDGGAWTHVTTDRLIAGIIISALDDGAGAGGGIKLAGRGGLAG